ncbi:MAG: acetyl-CoA C-acyltransferase [Nitrosomonas sp.]|nr:acetyl-CoA C-acyltransferase [Nitrosomonas sp.]
MTKQIQEAYIVAAIRSPVGKAPRGMFRHVRPDDLLVHVLQSALKQCEGMDPAAIDDVVVGCAMPEAEQGINVARVAVLLAGLPDSVPGMTINRFCASGLQAVAIAANRIRLGEADIIIAAGTESMSMIPMMGNKVSMNPHLFANSDNVAIAYGMGITAEKVAERWKVSREEQDAFALQSHQRAINAIEQGEFKEEIAPYFVEENQPDLNLHKINHVSVMKDTDEGPRTDTSLEALARLRPAFAAQGSVTAGNSSQMSDGAGAVVMMSAAAMQRFNVTPLGRFIGYSVAGVPPEIMGIGPIKAIPKVLQQTGIKQDALDWIELNEAFAAQSLAVINELGLNPVKVNPLGGAIALGHPLGATGAIRVATLLNGLRRHKLRYGMVTMCVGSGMGAAGVFEAL